MDIHEQRIQRILILIPGLVLFYFYVFQSKLLIVYILATLQIATHIYLLSTNKQCNPRSGKLCNQMALIIGILFMIIILKYKLGVIPFCIAIYMVFSHIVTIYPIRRTFVYKEMELPLFKKESYIFILCNLFHERKLAKLLEKLLDMTDGCIIDAGAYIGDSFLLLAKQHQDRTFYMIEPSKKNVDFIKQVKTRNVRVAQALLSDGNHHYSSVNEHEPNASYKQNEENGIRSIKVDDLIHEKVGIMHYDVEGMELEVIKGSLKLIKRDNPIVIVESLGRHQDKTNEIIYLMKEMKYKTLLIDESCNTFDIFDLAKCRNYVFVPEKIWTKLKEEI